MLVYRYEHKDGGGPFFTQDGRLRTNKKIKFDDGLLSGCLSLDLLKKYWKEQYNSDLYLKDCSIKIYDVLEKDIIKSRSHILFPNKYCSIN